jgi:hypothetical protein
MPSNFRLGTLAQKILPAVLPIDRIITNARIDEINSYDWERWWRAKKADLAKLQ